MALTSRQTEQFNYALRGDGVRSDLGTTFETALLKLDGVEALADVTDATNVNAAGAVMESDYNAHTVLAATSDNTPVALTVGEATVVGRAAGGNIAALSGSTLSAIVGTALADSGAAGAVIPANIAGLAATASTVRVRSVLCLAFPFVAADFAATDDIVLALPAGHDVVITDVKCHLTTVEGGACTAVLRTAANGGGTAISSALDLDATDGDMLRTTTIGGQAVAASGSLYFHASTNPGTCAGTLYVEFVHTT